MLSKFERKYKDSYKDNYRDKDPTRITETLTVCYIFGILITQAYACLVDLIDVTQAVDDANAKLVEVIIVADLDAENHVDDSFGFGADLEA